MFSFGQVQFMMPNCGIHHFGCLLKRRWRYVLSICRRESRLELKRPLSQLKSWDCSWCWRWRCSGCLSYKWWSNISSRTVHSAACHGKRSKNVCSAARMYICVFLSKFCAAHALKLPKRTGSKTKKQIQQIENKNKNQKEKKKEKPAASFFTRRLHNDWQFIMPASCSRPGHWKGGSRSPARARVRARDTVLVFNGL